MNDNAGGVMKAVSGDTRNPRKQILDTMIDSVGGRILLGKCFFSAGGAPVRESALVDHGERVFEVQVRIRERTAEGPSEDWREW